MSINEDLIVRSLKMEHANFKAEATKLMDERLAIIDDLREKNEALLEAAKEMFDVIARKVHGGASAKWGKTIAQAEEKQP